MEEFTISRTSPSSAEVQEPVVLSETATTRRIFQGELVRRPEDNRWLIKGTILCQRKSAAKAWEDIKSFRLTQLGAGEEVPVTLSSEQTERLLSGLKQLEAIAQQKGVRSGTRKLLVGDAERTVEVTDNNKKLIIDQLLSRNYGEDVWRAIADRNPDLATRLSVSRVQYSRRQALDEFSSQLKLKRWLEQDWEKFFWKHQWIFGYGLSYQFLTMEQRQANYGGMNRTGRGSQKGEVLARTSGLESFTVVVEIKRPETPIFSSQDYRNGVPGFSADFIGGVSQAQVNSRSWDFEGSRRDDDREQLESRGVFTIAPRSILVVGLLSQIEKSNRRKAFEIFRKSLTNPDILTFDELLERAKHIVAAEDQREGH